MFGAATQGLAIPMSKTLANMKRITNQILDVADRMHYPATLRRQQAIDKVIELQRALTKEYSRLTIASYQQGNRLSQGLANARAEVRKISESIKAGAPKYGSRDLAVAKQQVTTLEKIQAGLIKGWGNHKIGIIWNSRGPLTMPRASGRTILDLNPVRPKNPFMPTTPVQPIPVPPIPGKPIPVKPARSGVKATLRVAPVVGVAKAVEAVGLPMPHILTPKVSPAPSPLQTPATTPAPVTTRTPAPEPTTAPVRTPALVPYRTPALVPTSAPVPYPTQRPRTRPRTGFSFQPSQSPASGPSPAPVPEPIPVPTPTPTPTPTPPPTRPGYPPYPTRPLEPRGRAKGGPKVIPLLLPDGRPLPPGQFPRVIEFAMGKTIVQRNLTTGATDYRVNKGNPTRSPQETLVVVSTSRTKPRRQRLDLGIVDIVFVGARVRFERSTNTGIRVRKLRESGMRGS